MTEQEELEMLRLYAEAKAKNGDSPKGIFSRIMTGLGDVVYGGAQLLENTTEAVAPGLAETIQDLDESLYGITNGVIGSPEGVDMDDKVAVREQIYRDQTGIQEGEFDGARLTGQVLSGLAAPLVRGLPALAAEGALFNTAMPTEVDPSQGETYWGETAEDAIVGATGGLAAKGAQEVGSHIVNQYGRPALQRIRDAGVEPTVGQSIGGAAGTFEEAASSIPFMGALFSAPRGRALDEWQLSVLNQVVSPVGGKVTETGTQGVSQASKLIGEAYDEAMEAMPTMAITPNVSAALADATGQAIDLGMNEAAERQFKNIMNKVVYSRMPKEVTERVGPSQTRNFDEITAENLKKVESELTAKINAKNVDPQLKQALTIMRGAIREQAGLQSQSYRDLIEGADYAYAMFKRVTKAQNADVNDSFTPAQLHRAATRSASENVAARGDALMQAEASAAQDVLGNTLNNSGSAERLAAITLGTQGAGMINPMLYPVIPMLGAGGSRAGQRTANTLIESLLAPGLESYVPGSAYGMFANEMID